MRYETSTVPSAGFPISHVCLSIFTDGSAARRPSAARRSRTFPAISSIFQPPGVNAGNANLSGPRTCSKRTVTSKKWVAGVGIATRYDVVASVAASVIAASISV
jgi:hypothetical protein